MSLRSSLAMFSSAAFTLAAAAQAASWIPIGPSGGNVGDLLVAPSDNRVLYATTPDLYRSDDGGNNWSLQGRGDYRLAGVDPHAPMRLFILGGDALLVSNDGGRTFATRRAGLPRGVAVVSVTFFPGRARSMLATTSKGIFRSDNGGRTWKATGLAIEVASVALSPRDPGLWLALETLDYGTHNPSGTVWRSQDAGKTWTTRDVGYGPYGIEGPVFDPLDPSRVYLMDGGLGLLVSRDGGDTFDTTPDSPRASFLRASVDGALYAVNRYATTSSNRLLVSRDHGATWSRPAGGAGSGPADQLSQLLVLGHTLLACGPRGIWRSRDDGRTWRASSRGIFNLRTTSIAVASDGSAVYLGVLGEGVWRGDGTPEGWVPARRGLPTGPVLDLETWHAVASVPGRPERAVDLTPSGLFVTDDRAASWRRIDLPHGFDTALVNALIVDGADGDRIALAGARGILLSEDGGVSWRTVLQDYALGFAFDGGDPERLYAITLYGVRRSEDRGGTWIPLPAQLPEGRFIDKVWTVPHEAGALLVVTGDGGLYTSDDAGSTLHLSAGGTPGTRVWSMTPDPERPDNLYLLVLGDDASFFHTRLMAFSRADHALRRIADDPAPSIGAIAARPGRVGEIYGAGASVFRVVDEP